MRKQRRVDGHVGVWACDEQRNVLDEKIKGTAVVMCVYMGRSAPEKETPGETVEVCLCVCVCVCVCPYRCCQGRDRQSVFIRVLRG